MSYSTKPATTLNQDQRVHYLKMFVSKLLTSGTASEVVQYCENTAKPELEKAISNARLSFSKHKNTVVVSINHRLSDGKSGKESVEPIKVVFRVTGELNGYLKSPEYDTFRDNFNALAQGFSKAIAA